MQKVPLGPDAPLLETVAVVLVLAVALIYFYRRFWGKRRDPCADCASAATCPTRPDAGADCGCESGKP